MTESEWLNSTDPQAMLTFLRSSGHFTPRNLRLFACACCRSAWCHYREVASIGESDSNIVTSENFADGLVSNEEMQDVRNNSGALGELSAMASMYDALISVVDEDACKAAMSSADSAAGYLALVAAKKVGYSNPSGREARVCAFRTESSLQASLLRDIVGPLPFRPLLPLEAPVRAWNDGLIVKLATAIYEERSVPEGHLDSLRLGVLADALEEAGVTDEDILGHLRQQGAVHVRGCWCLDLLLAKE